MANWNFMTCTLVLIFKVMDTILAFLYSSRGLSTHQKSASHPSTLNWFHYTHVHTWDIYIYGAIYSLLWKKIDPNPFLDTRKTNWNSRTYMRNLLLLFHVFMFRQKFQKIILHCLCSCCQVIWSISHCSNYTTDSDLHVGITDSFGKQLKYIFKTDQVVFRVN